MEEEILSTEEYPIGPALEWWHNLSTNDRENFFDKNSIREGYSYITNLDIVKIYQEELLRSENR